MVIGPFGIDEPVSVGGPGTVTCPARANPAVDSALNNAGPAVDRDHRCVPTCVNSSMTVTIFVLYSTFFYHTPYFFLLLGRPSDPLHLGKFIMCFPKIKKVDHVCMRHACSAVV